MTFSLGTILLSWCLSNVDLHPHQLRVQFEKKMASVYIRGQAGWYGKGFQGKPTASGETFDMNKLTAAHRTLPFGTLVRVRHLGNGRSVVVRINDRGPFTRGRELDLSMAAARELGFVQQGHCKFEMVVLGSSEAEAPRKKGSSA